MDTAELTESVGEAAFRSLYLEKNSGTSVTLYEVES